MSSVTSKTDSSELLKMAFECEVFQQKLGIFIKNYNKIDLNLAKSLQKTVELIDNFTQNATICQPNVAEEETTKNSLNAEEPIENEKVHQDPTKKDPAEIPFLPWLLPYLMNRKIQGVLQFCDLQL